MSAFSLKMHKIQFCSRPFWGAYSAPRPSSWILEKGRRMKKTRRADKRRGRDREGK